MDFDLYQINLNRKNNYPVIHGGEFEPKQKQRGFIPHNLNVFMINNESTPNRSNWAKAPFFQNGHPQAEAWGNDSNNKPTLHFSTLNGGY